MQLINSFIKSEVVQPCNFEVMKRSLYLVLVTFAQYFCKRSRSRFRFKGYWSCISAFSSKIIRHIMYMIKTYIIKIQSRNLIHDNWSAVGYDPESQRSLTGTSSQKWYRFRFKFFEPEPGSRSFANDATITNKSIFMKISKNAKK